MNTAEDLNNLDGDTLAAIALVDTVILARFIQIFGMTDGAVRSKIKRGEWQESKEYLKDPDGRIHIILSGYQAWLYKGQKDAESEMAKSKSGFLKKARKNARIGHLSPASSPAPLLE